MLLVACPVECPVVDQVDSLVQEAQEVRQHMMMAQPSRRSTKLFLLSVSLVDTSSVAYDIFYDTDVTWVFHHCY